MFKTIFRHFVPPTDPKERTLYDLQQAYQGLLEAHEQHEHWKHRIAMFDERIGRLNAMQAALAAAAASAVQLPC